MGLSEDLEVLKQQGRQMIEEQRRTNEELKRVNETLEAILKELRKR